MRIKKIDIIIRDSSTRGVFHDSRQDTKNLARVCNILIDKANELTEEVNRLNKVINEMKQERK